MIDLKTLALRHAVEQDVVEAVSRARQTMLSGSDLFALRQFLGWHRLRFGCSPDAAELPHKLALFVRELGRRAEPGADVQGGEGQDRQLFAVGLKRGARTLSVVTLRRRVASISRVFAPEDGVPLSEHPVVLESIAAAVAQERHAKATSRAGGRAASPAALTALASTCDASRVGMRDRALLAAWAAIGGSLISVLRTSLGELLQSAGRCADIDRREQALEALIAWARLAGIETGPVFRRVRPDGSLGAPMTRSTAEQMIRRRLASAEVPSTRAPTIASRDL